jgi:PAS domain S-box-containing protein
MGAIDRFREVPEHDPTGMSVLGRRLKQVGALLLVAAMAAFVWAVGFTKGVDGLLEGLVIALAGFLVPAAVMLWIGWVLTNASADTEGGFEPRPAEPTRTGWIALLQAHLVALAAVALATMIRSWLTPYLGTSMVSPTFLLAVTVSAWVGGMGPAIFATALSVAALWVMFLAGESPLEVTGRLGDVVGLALFTAVALSIAGITSALRLTQSRSAVLRANVRQRDTALVESEQRFREIADDAPAMIWMTDTAGRPTFFNRARLDFTGQESEAALGDGWMEAVHPQDVRRCQHAFRNALERREAFKCEYRLRRHDGTYRSVADQGRPRIDRDGRFVGFIGAGIELSDAPVSLPH